MKDTFTLALDYLVKKIGYSEINVISLSLGCQESWSCAESTRTESGDSLKFEDSKIYDDFAWFVE